MVPAAQEDGTANPAMQELLDQQDEVLRPLRRGETVSGEVMKIDQGGILVSVGHKAEGVVPPQEAETLSPEEREAMSVGDTLVTYVVEPERGDKPALLSLDLARREEGWGELSRCLETGESLDVPAVGYNRGGLLVDVHGVRGFVPYSQLDLRGRNHQDDKSGEDVLAERVGERLSVKVVEVDRRRNRVILSERRAAQEAREQRKQKVLEELEEGQVRRGEVSSITSFGAFVDLGGADGLIHISELAWEPVATVGDVLSAGQEVEVYVLRVDRETGKIGLSLRRLQPEPWETVADRYHAGQLVEGTVTNLTTFGAFARIEGSVEGLVHISELSHKMLHHPKEAVNVGDVLTLKILHIDPERRRMGLSLKEAEGESLGE